MPPKKKQAPKDATEPGGVAMRALKKALDAANFKFNVEPLSLKLEPNEGFTAVSKLVLTALTATTTGKEMTQAHVFALIEALTTYPYSERLGLGLGFGLGLGSG